MLPRLITTAPVPLLQYCICTFSILMWDLYSVYNTKAQTSLSHNCCKQPVTVTIVRLARVDGLEEGDGGPRRRLLQQSW